MVFIVSIIIINLYSGIGIHGALHTNKKKNGSSPREFTIPVPAKSQVHE